MTKDWMNRMTKMDYTAFDIGCVSFRRGQQTQIKKMIKRQKEKYGWEFLFLGANIDAVETAKHFGIDKNRAVNYKADARGTGVLYNAVSSVVGSVRKSKAIEDTWCQEINEDFEKRS